MGKVLLYFIMLYFLFLFLMIIRFLTFSINIFQLDFFFLPPWFWKKFLGINMKKGSECNSEDRMLDNDESSKDLEKHRFSSLAVPSIIERVGLFWDIEDSAKLSFVGLYLCSLIRICIDRVFFIFIFFIRFYFVID
jgi:hypothetical protein